MFKLTPDPTFTATAPIGIPGAKTVPLKLQFKYQDRDEYFAWLERVREQKISDDKALPEIVVGWFDVDAEFSAEALATLLRKYPSAADSIIETYRTELFEARRKN